MGKYKLLVQINISVRVIQSFITAITLIYHSPERVHILLKGTFDD